MKIVFCAGADRTGKSTLTDEFRKNNYNYKHFGPPKGSPYAEYMNFVKNTLCRSDSDSKWIIDRFMYCEFPYSVHYGRKTDMTVDRMHEIENMILRLDPEATVIYCETDLESNWRRIESEGKREFAAIDDLDSLRTDYIRTLEQSKLNVIRYDFTKGDMPADAVMKIEQGI